MSEKILRHLAIYSVLFAVGLAIWFSTLFVPPPTWDEGIYFYMARDVSEGNLLYLNYWDFKPPLFFAIIGLFYKIWPTIWGVRIFMVAYIALAGWVLYLSGRRINGSAAGWIAGLLWVISSHYVPHVMTEQVASLPLAILCLLLTVRRFDMRYALCMGLAISCASLIRTNLVVLMPFCIGAMYIWHQLSNREVCKYAIYCLIGFSLPYVFVFAVYTAAGHFHLAWTTLVLLPLNYPHEGTHEWGHLWKNFVAYLFWVQQIVSSTPILLLLSISTPVGLVFLFFVQGWERRAIFVLLLMQVAIFISISLMVRRYEHYLIQYFPFAALLLSCSVMIAWRRREGKMFCTALALITGIYILVPLFQNSVEEWQALHSASLVERFPEYEAAEALKAEAPPGTSIFSCNTPIVGLLAGGRQPVRFVMWQPNFMLHAIEGQTYDFMKAGQAAQAEYMVDWHRYSWYYPCFRQLPAEFMQEYNLWYERDGLRIFKRKSEANH